MPSLSSGASRILSGKFASVHLFSGPQCSQAPPGAEAWFYCQQQEKKLLVSWPQPSQCLGSVSPRRVSEYPIAYKANNQQGRVTFDIHLRTPAMARPSQASVTGPLESHYQGCSAVACLKFIHCGLYVPMRDVHPGHCPQSLRFL